MADGGHEGIVGVTFYSDGRRLTGVLYLARGAQPKPSVLLLHGCPGLEQNLDLAVSLRDSGRNALVFHYRGSWGSSGRYDLRTIVADVRAAADHLHAGGYPSVDPTRLAVFGHSLGGWAAVLAAASDQRLRAVAACAPVIGFGELKRTPGELEQEMTRFLETTPAEFISQVQQVAASPGPLDVVATISPRPVLIVHGSADEWIPVAHGQLLFSCAGQPRRYAEVARANHAFAWHRAELRELVVAWLAEIGL